MPMFATLLARDIRATVSWYTTGLGFIDLFTIPGPHGDPVLLHLRRWQFQDLLLRPAREPATLPTGCTLSFAAARPAELADAAFSEQMNQWSSQQGLRPDSPDSNPERPTP
jgi:catechol 2,3-dioxygenase-like lactoylglutathione lyase family enzyme